MPFRKRKEGAVNESFVYSVADRHGDFGRELYFLEIPRLLSVPRTFRKPLERSGHGLRRDLCYDAFLADYEPCEPIYIGSVRDAVLTDRRLHSDHCGAGTAD